MCGLDCSPPDGPASAAPGAQRKQMPWPHSLWIPRPGTTGAESLSTADSGCRGIPLSGLALALVAHAVAVGLVWRGPEVSSATPAVLVQLITRPAPEPSPVPVPQASQVEAPSAPVRPGARPLPRDRPDVPPVSAPRPEPMPKPRPEPAVAAPPAAEPEARDDLAEAPASPLAGAPTDTLVPASPAVPAPAAAPLAVPDLAVQCPHRPPPRYPPAARRLGQEGVVELLVELSASGAVSGVAVVESSGAASLDRAAVAAVRGWRCAPARAGGVAVAARARQRIRFSLR